MLWIGLVVGIIIGFLIKTLFEHRKSVGTIYIYPNDEPNNEPYIFLELEQDVKYLLNKKSIVLNVKECQNPNDTQE